MVQHSRRRLRVHIRLELWSCYRRIRSHRCRDWHRYRILTNNTHTFWCRVAPHRWISCASRSMGPPPPSCTPKWAAVGPSARARGVRERDGGRGWLLAILACLPACVCLGLDVIAWVPLVCGPGVCVKVCVVLLLGRPPPQCLCPLRPRCRYTCTVPVPKLVPESETFHHTRACAGIVPAFRDGRAAGERRGEWR